MRDRHGKKPSDGERRALLVQIDQLSEKPLAFLGFVWLALLIADMTHTLSRPLAILSAVLYAVFIADFLLRLYIAPDKKRYLKRNWILALSLLVPVVRVVRMLQLLRVLRVLPGMSILMMVGSVTRSMHSLNAALRRRGFIYVVLLTVIVVLVSAAGMYAFEKGQRGSFKSYGDAVLWTTMILITLYGEYWPATLAGKLLMLGVGIYSFSMLGYIAATIGAFFTGMDASSGDQPEKEDGKDDINELRRDIQALAALVADMKKAQQPG